MVSPKISIIVPVYNAEKYLHRCIDSILTQTFSDFELLLIDDGSTDKSGQLCNEYASKDNRVKVFHKQNGGVSSARNLGLDNAKGEWIAFVDSDDSVMNTYLSELISSNDVDLVVSGVRFINGNTSLLPPVALINIKENQGLLDEQLCYSYFRTPWSKLFKNRIIQLYSLRFSSFLRIGEDTDFVLRYLYEIKTLEFIPVSSYCYNDSGMMGGLQRYSMNAIDVYTHLSYIIISLNRLKSKLHYDFALFESEIKIYFRRLFFVYLVEKVPTYPEFVKESKSFKRCNGIYYDESRFREWFVTLMLRHFPFFAYIFLKRYRKNKCLL